MERNPTRMDPETRDPEARDLVVVIQVVQVVQVVPAEPEVVLTVPIADLSPFVHTVHIAPAQVEVQISEAPIAVDQTVVAREDPEV